MFCSPDYSPLCPDTIMNNTSFQAQGYSFERIDLYLCSRVGLLMNVSKYMANQMKCEFKATFALNFSEMLSQEKL